MQDMPNVAASHTDEASDVADVAARLLAASPHALVVALGQHGLCVEMPASIDLAPTHRPISAASILDLVTLPTARSLIEAWDGLDDANHVYVEVALRDAPDDPVLVHLVDTREIHGVVLGVVLDSGSESVARSTAAAPALVAHQLAQALPVGALQVGPDGDIAYVNRRLEEITGTRGALTLKEQFASATPTSRTAIDDAFERVLRTGVAEQHEISFGDDGQRRIGDLQLSSIDLGQPGLGVIVCLTDTTANATLQKELHTKATRDSLTGCHNREAALAFLDRQLESPEPGLAVVFIDLDDFKAVNDNLGHTAGDNVLIEVGRRLRDVVRSEDTVGRFGGDEFIVISPNATSPTAADRLGERISSALEFEMIHDVGFIKVRATIGPAWIGERGETADAIVARADEAMYEQKRRRKEATGRSSRSAGALWDAEVDQLIAAMDNDELELHFRPVVQLATTNVRGVEAVLRWRRDGELLSASSFVASAEQNGAIVAVGQWVIERIARDMAAARDGGADGLAWFVDLSGRELAADAGARLAAEMSRFDLDPADVVVQVSRSSQMLQSPSMRLQVHQLAENGFGIGLDDFGSGWSSLSMVQRLPVSWIKVAHCAGTSLDASFMSDELVASVRELATRLHVTTLAEGVTTDAQRRRLLAMGVEWGQGDLFGRAVPVDDLIALLSEQT